jgi:hypothetical protein
VRHVGSEDMRTAEPPTTSDTRRAQVARCDEEVAGSRAETAKASRAQRTGRQRFVPTTSDAQRRVATCDDHGQGPSASKR